jgi:hypothetical protein
MLAPSSDPSRPSSSFDPIPFHDRAVDIGRSERRPAWWLDESEHARVLGVKPGSAKARRATTFVAKPRTDLAPPALKPVEPAPTADFATLVSTLASLDRILQPLASDAPGLATTLLSRRRIAGIGRFGAAFGLATLAAAVVFFR